MTPIAKFLTKVYKQGNYANMSHFARSLNMKQATFSSWMNSAREPNLTSLDKLIKSLKKIGIEVTIDELR